MCGLGVSGIEYTLMSGVNQIRLNSGKVREKTCPENYAMEMFALSRRVVPFCGGRGNGWTVSRQKKSARASWGRDDIGMNCGVVKCRWKTRRPRCRVRFSVLFAGVRSFTMHAICFS